MCKLAFIIGVQRLCDSDSASPNTLHYMKNKTDLKIKDIFNFNRRPVSGQKK